MKTEKQYKLTLTKSEMLSVQAAFDDDDMSGFDKMEKVAEIVVDAGYASKDWVDEYIESVKELNHVSNQD